MSETTTKPVLVEYSVSDGKVTRTHGDLSEHVANYEASSGLLQLLPEHTRYRVPIIKHLNDKGYKYEGLTQSFVTSKPTGSIPPRPKVNPRIGDKTDSVVEWYARYHTEEFIARYGVRELQVRTGWESIEVDTGRVNANGDPVYETERRPIYERTEGLDYSIPSLKSGEQRLIADRQTCLTHKLPEHEADADYDWSLDATVDDRRKDGGRI